METVKGFGHELAKMGQAKAAPFRLAEDIGLNVAQNAAIERATLDGIQAGQTPGQTLLPAFTDSDRAFVDAYKKEEYATVTRQAETFLNNIYNEAAANPSQKSLEAFENASRTEFLSLADMVSEENRPQLKRSLIGAYENKYYQLVNKIQHKNEAMLKNSFKMNIDNAVSQIQDYQANSQPEKAKAALEENIAYVRSLVGTPAIQSKDEADSYIKSLQKTYDAAKVQSEMQEALQEGRGAEVLAERSKLPLTVENAEINKALYKQYQNYNRLIGFQSTLSKMQALGEAENGTLTSSKINELKSRMSEQDKADLDLKLTKINARNAENFQNIDFINANKENEVKLATVPAKALDAAYNQQVKDFISLLGREPTMEEAAQLISDYKVPIPKFNKQLGVMINSSDPDTAIQGAQIYSGMYLKNPRALDEISDKTGAKADMIASRIKAGMDPVDAVNIANNAIANLDAKGIEEHKAQFKETVLSKYNTPTLKLKLAASEMGINKAEVPDGFVTDYMQNLEDGFVITQSIADAKEYAKKNMSRIWKETNINGVSQVMWMPPEVTLPFDGDTNYIRKLLTSKVKDYVEQNTKDNSGVFNSLSRIKENITKKEDKTIDDSLYIMSDKYTALPGEGTYPSYGVYVKTDSVLPKPLMDSDGTQVRFTVTDKDVEEFNNAQMKRDQARYNSILEYEKVQSNINHVLNRYERD